MPDTKRKLLDSAMHLMIRQGYTATTVDQVCCDAGLTKGSFFHYFKSKEQIGEAAIDYFSCCRRESFAKGDFNQIEDPLDRILGMLDFIAGSASDPSSPKACLVGNLAQELSQTNPELRSCCEDSFNQWTRGLSSLLKEAQVAHPPRTRFDPDSVANMILSLIQGSIMVSKTRQDTNIFAENVRHCRSYIETLFGRDARNL